jgi:hypothetical protein
MEKATTSHSQWKIPLKVSKTMTSHLTRDNRAKRSLYNKTVLCVWDEITMAHRYIFQCACRCFNDLTGGLENKAFHEITTVLSGDYRQTAPIIRNGSRQQIIQATVKNSKLLQKVTIYLLFLFFTHIAFR